MQQFLIFKKIKYTSKELPVATARGNQTFKIGESGMKIIWAMGLCISFSTAADASTFLQCSGTTANGKSSQRVYEIDFESRTFKQTEGFQREYTRNGKKCEGISGNSHICTLLRMDESIIEFSDASTYGSNELVLRSTISRKTGKMTTVNEFTGRDNTTGFTGTCEKLEGSKF